MKIKILLSLLFLLFLSGCYLIFEANPTTIPNTQILKKFEYKTNLYPSHKLGSWHLEYPNNSYHSKLNYLPKEQAYGIQTVREKNKKSRDGWKSALSSPSFELDPSKRYQLILKIKSNTFPLGQNLMITLRGPKGKTKSKWESLWNVSKKNRWEEVYIPINPLSISQPKNNKWRITIFSSLAYGAYDLEKNSTVLISEDIEIFELPLGKELVNTQDINLEKDKVSFESSTRKVDALGNFYRKDTNGSWQHIFPKLIYRDASREDYNVMFSTYKEYGFNGIMDLITPKQIEMANKVGLNNLSINLNYARNKQNHQIEYPLFEKRLIKLYKYIKESKIEDKIIWHNFDNENYNISDYTFQTKVANFIDTHNQDSLTKKRQYPIYYLNGQPGLARSYLNNSRNIMDITGSYVGEDEHGNLKNGKKDLEAKILTQFLTPYQKAPTSVIQLQKHFDKKFIPSLFYGIIQGGKALSVWRDGSTWKDNTYDFRNAPWAKAFKDDVSPKLNQLLPLIKEPHITQWSASSNMFPSVRIGTRELNHTKYLILTNFSNKNEQITLTLQGVSASKAIDYFTGVLISSIQNQQLKMTIGHHNLGYRVLKLLD